MNLSAFFWAVHPTFCLIHVSIWASVCWALLLSWVLSASTTRCDFRGFWFSTKIGTVFLLFWSVVLIIFSEEAVALFRNDPDVIAIGIKALRYQMIVFPACSFMMMANMMMQTCRKTIRANILAASRQGLFFIPIIIILPHYFGLLGVEICQAVSDLISFLVTIPIVWTAFREMSTER